MAAMTALWPHFRLVLVLYVVLWCITATRGPDVANTASSVLFSFYAAVPSGVLRTEYRWSTDAEL